MKKIFSKGDHVEHSAIAWLVRLQSPRMTAEQETAFFQWLAADPAHQAAYIKAEHLWERGIVLERATEREVSRRFGWFISPWFRASLAGVATLLIGLAYLTYLHPLSSPSVMYETVRGQQREVILEDGSRLFLNTDSSLVAEFQPNRRIVYLKRGEVYFDIRSNEDRPFEVVTDSGVVRVLGTRFSVFDSGSRTLVTVVEGKVALGASLSSQDDFSAAVTLTANQRLALEDARQGSVPEQVDAEAMLAWRNKQLVYRGNRLDEVIADLERYFDVHIRLGDPALADKEVVAVIQLADFRSTLSAVEHSLQLRSVSVDNGNGVLLYPQ